MSAIYWIGGCPSGGKTTVTGRLREAYGFKAYHTDEHAGDFIKRIEPEAQPNLHVMFRTGFDQLLMLPDDEWLNTTVAAMHELFPMILDDLGGLGPEDGIIAEGAELLPELVARNRAVCVNPSQAYLAEYLPKQGWVRRILSSFDDADYKALFMRRLLRKYDLYRQYLLGSAESCRVPIIITENPGCLEKNLLAVKTLFGLP